MQHDARTKKDVQELLDEKNFLPLFGFPTLKCGRLFSFAMRLSSQVPDPILGEVHHHRIESVLACSGIHGCVSKLKGPQKSRGVCENDTFPGLLLRAL